MTTERILPRKFPKDPRFIIPLNSDELRELGTFSAIWSQVDYLLLMLISCASGASLENVSLMYESVTTGPRVGILTKLCKRRAGDRDKRLVKILDKNGGLIEDRNRLSHGVWTVEIGKGGNDLPYASCYYSKTPEKILPATKIATLSDRAAKLSGELGEILGEYIPAMAGTSPGKFFTGDHDPIAPPPQWPPKSA